MVIPIGMMVLRNGDAAVGLGQGAGLAECSVKMKQNHDLELEPYYNEPFGDQNNVQWTR